MPASPQIALLLIRLGFGYFLLIWGLNKIVNPAHTAQIFQRFYYLAELTTPVSVLLGLLQVALSLGIIAGFLKALSYGLGVLVHATSTLATGAHLLLPFAEGSNILFMAGLPVLTAAIGLFLARDADTLLSLDSWLQRGRPACFASRSTSTHTPQ